MRPFRLHLALVAVACLAGAAARAQVTPPPLPPGSNLVRAEPGMNEAERKRHVRAHHHKFHHRKDYTRDDSVHGHESVVRVQAPAAAGAGGAAAAPAGATGSGSTRGTVQDGRGTGPTREKTDKGASSYFYGTDKK